MTIYGRFKQFEDDYLKFEDVTVKQSNRPDLNAFVMLNQLVPGTMDLVSGAEHDEIYLSVELEDLNKAATDEQIHDLVRCGIMVSEYNCLSMFV